MQSKQRFGRLARPLQYLYQPGTIPDESWLSFPKGLREKSSNYPVVAALTALLKCCFKLTSELSQLSSHPVLISIRVARRSS